MFISLKLSALENQKWDLVICDHSMPHFSGTDALKLLRDRGADVPFIFVSGTIGEDTAVSALKLGAQDYVRNWDTTGRPRTRLSGNGSRKFGPKPGVQPGSHPSCLPSPGGRYCSRNDSVSTIR
jgi:hypothetical protein